MTTHRLDLRYVRPPLHANQRLHWAKKARLTADARKRVRLIAGSARIGRHDHVTVGLEWRPPDRRRRDGGENLAPLVKPLIDGLVDAGVVPDDTPEHVERRIPVLLPVDDGAPGMWLVVETP